jgi:hypothetical protein
VRAELVRRALPDIIRVAMHEVSAETVLVVIAIILVCRDVHLEEMLRALESEASKHSVKMLAVVCEEVASDLAGQLRARF